MRKALPVLWRYLAVVAVSCLLTFFISQSKVEASTVTAAVPTKVSTTQYAASSTYETPGMFEVVMTDAVWRDANRNRDVPVRFFSPKLPIADDWKTKKPATPQSVASYPVILFSHGLGGSREGGETWGKHWASHGYIVLHLQHAGSDEAIWKDKEPGQRMLAMKSSVNLKNSELRIDDVHFVLDEIKRLHQKSQGSQDDSQHNNTPWANADLSRIGMSGHSYGSQTTLAISGQLSPLPGAKSSRDDRIKAAIAFSPNARVKFAQEKQFGNISIPFFSITGTKDGAVLGDGTIFEDRMVPYKKMPVGEKYLAVFKDGDHMVFGGHILRRAETARDREIQAEVKAATLAFWNSTLKQDVSAQKWLTSLSEGGFSSTLVAGDLFENK